jgi:RHS repeat-associated protein
MLVLTHLRRPKWFRWLAATMAFVLAAVLLGDAPALAAPKSHRPSMPSEKSVPGRRAGIAPLPPDQAERKAVRTAPKVSWPAAGSATVDLPGPVEPAASAASAAARVRSRAGKLPVYVGPTTQGPAPQGSAAQGPATQGPAAQGPVGAAASAGSPGPGSVAGTGTAPTRVRVNLLGHSSDGLLLRVNRDDGAPAAGRVALEVDYSGFRDAYGGDWATRLRLVALPECGATTPDRPECRGTPVPTANNGSGRLSGDVEVGGAGSGLFAVAAAAAGTAGDFGATGLSPSSTWQAGGPSGDFTWTYPMIVPPALGGPTPDLTVNYSSGDVDGRTTGTNNQPSWVGEGFEFTPGGFVERRYTPCASDMKAQNGSKPNNTTKTGDLCWGTDNLLFSINGHGGELVRDDATGAYHPRVDDGSRVEHLYDTATGNGARNGEYWRITNRMGVQYYFGRNKLPGWTGTTNPQTQSVWTVPVFGNHPGEACHQSTFDASSCVQAWRWNLDYVVDPHGNTMSYFYQPEKNNYARNLSASKVSTYVRGGYLEHIEYGQRDGEVYTKPWVGRVLFGVADRCLPSTTCDSAHPANWPDVPWDQACTSSTNCNNKFTPTFWSQKRLATVKTQVWGGTAARDVDQWKLTQSYPDPGDGTKPRLWLASLQRTGLVGGSASLPAINFDGVQMPNRVDGTDHIPPMDWWRMKAIHTESGDEIRVNYSTQECNYQSNLPAPDSNGKRCHPLRWTPEGLSEQTDWFNKYVVTDVSESDRITGFTPEISKVEYVGPAAWRHDDEDGLVPEDRKTWSQWRGYERVRVHKGRQGEPLSLTEMHFFRGMDGDVTATPGVKKSVQVVDSTNTAWQDTDQFAGAPRETVTYTGDGASILSRTITDPWLSSPTATRTRSWGTTSAYQVQEKRVAQGEADSGQWRQTATTHGYDADGTLLQEYEQGDLADPADDKCTNYTYGRNQSAWILEVPSQKRTSVGGCDRQPTGPQDIVSDERFYYDGNDTLGAAPARGDITRREEIAGWSGGAATYATTMRAGYDAYGRLAETRDAYDRRQTMAYTPADGPTTRITSTNALGQVTTTDVETAWGAELGTTKPDGRRTAAAYDPLGRVVKTWQPGRDKNTQSPNEQYEYLVRNDGPSVLITNTLVADGTYRPEYKLLDGKMRVRQTQTASPNGGRVVTDLDYDARGRKVAENGPYYNDAPPGTDLLLPDESALPAQTVTEYDDADRPTADIFKVMGVEKWRTTYVHHADRQDTIPPAGDTPTTRILDAEGRLVELRQYKGATASGDYDATRYTYTPRGELATVTDPAGNVTRFFYDARGRRIRTEDPDQGVSQYTFGDGGEMLTETDSRGVTLAFEYDALGRKTALRDGSATGPKLAEWTYDKLADGTPAPGLPATATRYVGGAAYTDAITGYDSAGRVTGQAVTIPASEGALAGTYQITKTYRPDGEVDSTTLPAMGGLPQETERVGYNSLGMPTTLAGASTYVTATGYTEYGELAQLTLNAGGKSLYRDFRYETGTRRLASAATRRETGAQLISNVSYGYDPAGNVVRMSDTPDPATGEAADTQCFHYDTLRRLTEAWTPSSGDCAAAPNAQALGGAAPYWHAWTFDAAGNRLTETRTAPGGATTTSRYGYNAPGGAQPHALRQVSTASASGTTTNQYDYDPAGNLTRRTRAGVGQTLEWDAEGHVTKVTENNKTTSYLYDAAGDRLISRDPSGATLYFGDTELHVDTGGGVVGTRYYSQDEQLVAMRSGLNGRLTWLVSDHHGTAELAVDETTQQVQRRRHDPYGNTRGTATANVAGDRGFVGGVTDASTGLTHLGARDYDPTVGRFVSVDPEIDFTDPQQMNGYAYANNSPVTFSDPDGRQYVTKLVTMWKTVYQTVVRRVVETIRVLVTILALLSLFLGGLIWAPVVVPLIKTIVRYIKEIRKTLVKITKLIKVFMRTESPKVGRQLSKLASQLDSQIAHAENAAQAAMSFIMLATSAMKPDDRDKPHHRSFLGKVWHKVASTAEWVWDHRATVGRWLAVAGFVACVIATSGICTGVAVAGAAWSIMGRSSDLVTTGGWRKPSGWVKWGAGSAMDIGLAKFKAARAVGWFKRDATIAQMFDATFRSGVGRGVLKQFGAAGTSIGTGYLPWLNQ